MSYDNFVSNGSIAVFCPDKQTAEYGKNNGDKEYMAKNIWV